MTRSDYLLTIEKLKRSIAVATRLCQFIARNDVQREQMRENGIERSAFQVGYDQALRNIERNVILGEPL